MTTAIPYSEDPYGFTYGAARITRACSDHSKGWVILMLDTPKQSLQLYVTKTGKVRVFDHKLGKELKL